MAADMPVKLSLENFAKTDPRATINSPRSLQACKNEGVLVEELVYKPIEQFAEKNLSPRLVKLRYDFFEAKRRDLLEATKRTRAALISEEKKDREGSSHQQLEAIAKVSGLTKGAVLALNSDNLKLERQRLLKAQEIERNWLKNALRNELAQLQTLENHDKRLSEEGGNDEEKVRQKSIAMKELNDKRRLEEERKQVEIEARQKLEKQIAKEEFHKQQLELKKAAEAEARKQKEAYERQCREADRKKQVEREKEEKRMAEFEAQCARKDEMRAQDLKRTDLMEQQRLQFQDAMMEKKALREDKIIASVEMNQKLEQERREIFEAKQQMDLIREEKLAQNRAIEQEEMAKRSFQLMMRRKCIQEESARKQEERRLAIIDQQEETEMRLLEHEQKKERYLDFKRELDGLRQHNKDVNVQRQRRREEAKREAVGKHVQSKDEKMEWLVSERKRLHQIRRATQSEAYRCREMVKNEIMKQRVASRYSAKDLHKQMEEMMKHELFSSKVLSNSTSLPNIPVHSRA